MVAPMSDESHNVYTDATPTGDVGLPRVNPFAKTAQRPGASAQSQQPGAYAQQPQTVVASSVGSAPPVPPGAQQVVYVYPSGTQQPPGAPQGAQQVVYVYPAANQQPAPAAPQQSAAASAYWQQPAPGAPQSPASAYWQQPAPQQQSVSAPAAAAPQPPASAYWRQPAAPGVPQPPASASVAPQQPTSTIYTPQPPGASPNSVVPLNPAAPLKEGRAVSWVAAAVAVFLAFAGIEVVAVIAFGFIGMGLYGLLFAMTSSVVSDVLTSTDLVVLLELFAELGTLAVMVPWWTHVSKRGIGTAPRRGFSGRAHALTSGGWIRRVAILLMIGVGANVAVSLALDAVLPLFPDALESYEELMDSSGTMDSPLFGFLAVAVVAPLLEETAFRGVAFQFALRAVCPDWKGSLQGHSYSELRVTENRFWIANCIQALVFAIAHMNLVQGVYAFALGLLLGWVMWRTGSLACNILLHALFNATSFALVLVPSLSGAAGVVLLLGLFALGVVLLVAGLSLFRRDTVDDALDWPSAL